MFCEKCGSKLSDKAAFCEGCGNPIGIPVKKEKNQFTPSKNIWWYRLSKTLYIIAHLLLLLIIPLLSGTKDDFLVWKIALGYFLFLKLIKISFFYVVFSQKPKWMTKKTSKE